MTASVFANYLNASGYGKYLMDPSNQIIGVRKVIGESQYTVFEYQDGTEWVHLTENAIERFCGCLFLENALKTADLIQKILPAENKIAIHQRKIIYLSRYCGEEKVDHVEYFSEIESLNKIGFTDIILGSNLRKENDKIYVFDTEKTSFIKSARKEIDGFKTEHDSIRAVLEGILN